MIGNKNNFKNRGFTLIEMIVVVAIFLLIIGVAINIFISVIENQRSILMQEKILNQISYVSEYMSKALRMAKVSTAATTDTACIPVDFMYELTRPIAGSYYQGIKFINASDNNACTEFFLDMTDPNHPVLKELKNSTNEADAVALTSQDINFESLKFAINGIMANTTNFQIGSPKGASVIDGLQPRLTMVFNIKGGDKVQPMILQTTISARNINGQ